MIACAVCDRVGNWQRHHPTAGVVVDGKYLDRKLTFVLCHDHHWLVHEDLNTLGLTQVEQRLTLVERVVVRLRRLAAALARLDEAREGGTVFGSLAAALVRWADELAVAVEAWDQRDPTWRRDARQYPEGR